MRKAEREVRGNRDEGSGEEGWGRRGGGGQERKKEGNERNKTPPVTEMHQSRTLLGKALQ